MEELFVCTHCGRLGPVADMMRDDCDGASPVAAMFTGTRHNRIPVDPQLTSYATVVTLARWIIDRYYTPGLMLLCKGDPGEQVVTALRELLEGMP